MKALHFGRVVKHVKFYDKVICKKVLEKLKRLRTSLRPLRKSS